MRAVRTEWSRFLRSRWHLGTPGEGARHLQELEKAYEAWREKLD
jgi:hypothetical protein